MARSRNIKPGFFKNEILATLAPIARIAFAGLWCVADRRGRLEDRPLRLKVEVLPYDDCDINAILCDLEDLDFIKRYEADNCKYIQILNFDKHQSPHKREAESTIPAPDKHCTATVKAPEEHPKSRPDSLNSDSLNPSSNAQSQIAQDTFNDFWTAYPKKKDKDKAFKAWVKKKAFGIAEKIISDVQDRKQNDWDWVKEDGKFIPYPSTYLNNKRWNDDLTPIPERKNETRTRTSQVEHGQNVSRMLEDAYRAEVAKEMDTGAVRETESDLRDEVGESSFDADGYGQHGARMVAGTWEPDG